MALTRTVMAALALATAGGGCAEARALPALEIIQTTAAESLFIWWRSGELMVAASRAAGTPARWPLDPARSGTLPEALVGWAPIGQTCATPPEARATLDGEPAVARVEGTPELPVITLSRAGARVGQGPLGQPATVCALAIVEADGVPGPELVVVWRLGAAPRAVQGLTVMRIPPTAR